MEFLKSRHAALRLLGTLAIASLASVKVQQKMDDTDAQRKISQVMRERKPAMDDDIADNDKIEYKESQFDCEDTTATGWEGSAILNRVERIRLRQEVHAARLAKGQVLFLTA